MLSLVSVDYLGRALGTHLSRVRSIKMDSWSEHHIMAMRQGGNKKCHNYLEKQGLRLKDCTIRERYESRVAEEYHLHLQTAINAVAEEHTNQGHRNDLVMSTLPAGATTATQPTLSPSAPRRFQRSLTAASATRTRPTRSLSASAPTIVYLGRSFKANNPMPDGSEETLRIDDWDVLTKLEHWWYHRDENGEEHYPHSNASNSLDSTSLSWSSYFGGYGSTATSRNRGPGLTNEDLRALRMDPQVKEYVRQQLLQRWNGQGYLRK